jgi:HEAT repeat protein
MRRVAGLIVVAIGSFALHASPLLAQERGVRELVGLLRASDPVSRARAACDLRELGDRAADAIEPLVALMDDATPISEDVCENNRNWGGRDGELTTPGKQAAAALVAIGSRSFTPVLNALRSSVWVARRNAAWALGALRDTRAVPPLIDAVKDREGQVREQVVWASARARSARHQPAHRSAESGNLRPSPGGLGAGRAPGHAGHRPARRDLEDREASVREQTAWALGALRDRTAVPGLAKALEDSDPKVRRQTAWALGAVRDPRAAEPLAAALKDREASVREQAAWASGALRDRTSVPPLIALLGDSEPSVRRQAARPSAPSAMHGPLEPLLTALKDADPSVRRQVAWAIGVVNK